MAVRIAFILLVLVPVTLVLLPVQLLILALKRPGFHLLPQLFFRLLAFALGLRVTLYGAPVAHGAVLIVSNHISWLDIVAIGAEIPISFVAKSEVAAYPLVGPMARLQRTIFVDRKRRRDAGRIAGEMGARLSGGHKVLLFAEGTSDIGTHVLPFKTSLLGAAERAMAADVVIQPMAIAYTAISGLPLSRHERPQIAWVGDMGIGDNFAAILSSGPKTVKIALGDPLASGGDRKAVARQAENKVRAMLVALNRSLPLPSPVVSV